jgi:hypothetical protein
MDARNGEVRSKMARNWGAGGDESCVNSGWQHVPASGSRALSRNQSFCTPVVPSSKFTRTYRSSTVFPVSPSTSISSTEARC